jgi:hypothetical protein
VSPRDPFSAIYYGVAAYAQFVGRNYEEAMRFSHEALWQRGDFVGAHRVLTASAAMAGQNDVAKAALQELRRVQPNISLGWIEIQIPIKRDVDRSTISKPSAALLALAFGSDADQAQHPRWVISVTFAMSVSIPLYPR